MRLSTRPHLRRSLLALATATLLVAGAAACGSDDNTSTDSGNGGTTTTAVDSSGGKYSSDDTSSDSGEAYTIVAKDFSLTDLTVEPGEKFTMKNEGSATHTATADDGSFDSGQVSGGSSSSEMTAPTEPGSYPFHCQIHASMTATLTVEG
jgi:plastocyanin